MPTLFLDNLRTKQKNEQKQYRTFNKYSQKLKVYFAYKSELFFFLFISTAANNEEFVKCKYFLKVFLSVQGRNKKTT